MGAESPGGAITSKFRYDRVRKNYETQENIMNIEKFREHIEKVYGGCPTGCGGSFDEILCFEFHDQPHNPRMRWKSFNNGYSTGLTFKELAKKWDISLKFLGQIIADHCNKLEGG